MSRAPIDDPGTRQSFEDMMQALCVPKLPSPFYQDETVTLYCGDAREILPLLEPVDLCLIDPPYPNLKGGLSITLTSGVGKQKSESNTVGEIWGDDISLVSHCSRLAHLGALVFCSWHWLDHLPDLLGGEKVGLLTWYQRNAMPPVNNVPHYSTEFVWATKYAPGLRWKNLKSLYDIPRLQTGCIASSERAVDTFGRALHPCQKPLSLIRQLLLCEPRSVLDFYCGTGTTLLAAKQLGISAIGVERDEAYCQIAVERLKQSILPFPAAPTPALPVRQAGLFEETRSES